MGNTDQAHWQLDGMLVTSLKQMPQLILWATPQHCHATSYYATQHEVMTQNIGLLAGCHCCWYRVNEGVMPQLGLACNG